VARVPVVIPQPVAPPTPAPPPTAPLGGDVLATLPLPLDGGSSAYWRQRNTENEIRLLQGGHANVLFLGDSITDSLSSGPGKPIWDMFFDPLDMDNFAVGGISTSQVLWQVETGQVALASPEVVVLMIGTNNLGLGQSPKAVAAGISKIVDELGQQLPHTQVLLLGILPRGQSPADPARQQIAQVNRLIAGLDDGRRVRFLDLGGGFVQPDGTISPAVMPDFLHPSLLGYQIYTISVWQPLMELLFWK
jgi:lysophospholipase L1-like esterase